VKNPSQRALSHPACVALFLATASAAAFATPPPPPTLATPAAPASVATPAAASIPPAAPGPSVLGNEKLKPGEFAWQPQFSTGGPLLVVVNIQEQMAYVYRNGLRIGRTSVSTGKTGHETPTGVFTILEKHEEHYSNKYNNAPMPFMQRLTWDGVALHAGKIPGYPASHGCVRLPYAFSELLFGATTKGVTVVIANDTPTPTMVAGNLIAPEATLSAQVEAAWAGAYTWDPSRAPDGPLTIVFSTKEQVAHVLRSGVEIGRVHVSVSGTAPEGTTAYVLLDGTTGEESKILPGQPALRWQVVGDSDDPDRVASLADGFGAGLVVPPAFAEKVYPLLTPGATVVITSEALSADDSMTALTVLRADEGGSIADARDAIE
jgi:lipoprotein-anchoring transpeptidase ErfK/SrfK